MENFVPFIILIPFLSFVIGLMIPKQEESWIYRVTTTPMVLQFLFFIAVSFLWLKSGGQAVLYKGPVLYHSDESEFSIDLYFDRYSAFFLAISAILTILDLMFSRYYMHRDRGYKRYFNNIAFFYFGLCVILCAGNFETLFIGWEIIGITSFFLIGFYRDRYLPVKNAMKVISIYRVADVSLLLLIWLCHHYFLKSMDFKELSESLQTGISLITDPVYLLVIVLLILIIAMVKSAQFPFSFWLPRAFEGPTTSSAIFYGSLSAHMGVFLLMRTYPLWSDHLVIKILIIVVGVISSIIATFIARVQSTVKTQIAYSSIAQIGMMFVEVALGFHWLAMIHFAGNAFLRTYQILVSPSVLNYLIHDQFFNFIPMTTNPNPGWWGKLKNSLYLLSIKEWNMDFYAYQRLWRPLKKAGLFMNKIPTSWIYPIFGILFSIGIYMVYHKEVVDHKLIEILPDMFSFISLILLLKVFVMRDDVLHHWNLIIISQLFVSLSIGFNDQFDYTQIHLYLSGIILSALIGYICIYQLKKRGEITDLQKYHGHSYEYPRLATMFMLACLGLAGFPVTPTFIGEDILLGHVDEHQYGLTAMLALILILDGLVVFRIYSRLFLGPHEKGYHETAYRSS